MHLNSNHGAKKKRRQASSPCRRSRQTPDQLKRLAAQRIRIDPRGQLDSLQLNFEMAEDPAVSHVSVTKYPYQTVIGHKKWGVDDPFHDKRKFVVDCRYPSFVATQNSGVTGRGIPGGDNSMLIFLPLFAQIFSNFAIAHFAIKNRVVKQSRSFF